MYGSNDKDPSNGILDDWTLIGRFTFQKPQDEMAEEKEFKEGTEFWIDEEEPLNRSIKSVDIVKYRRHIHKQVCEYTPEILNVAEEYEQCGKDESKTDIKYYKTGNGEQECEETPGKCDTVDNTEEKENKECKAEIYKRRNTL